MKTNIFTLCDSAKEYGGKLVIVGTLNQIQVATFPARNIQFDMVASIIFDGTDTTNHTLKISVAEKSTGAYVLPDLTTQIEITDKQDEQKTLNVILSCLPLEFPRAGEYTFTLTLDDVPFSISLFMKEVAQQSTQSQTD